MTKLRDGDVLFCTEGKLVLGTTTAIRTATSQVTGGESFQIEGVVTPADIRDVSYFEKGRDPVLPGVPADLTSTLTSRGVAPLPAPMQWRITEDGDLPVPQAHGDMLHVEYDDEAVLYVAEPHEQFPKHPLVWVLAGAGNGFADEVLVPRVKPRRSPRPLRAKGRYKPVPDDPTVVTPASKLRPPTPQERAARRGLSESRTSAAAALDWGDDG